ncbi:MAG: M48 family metalloprotease [Acidobacteria bacterium]|nr:M48 family metalloprotease [Acidobacteriota bacterium]
MNILADILPATIVQALGWTLIHSLWHGVVLAAALGLLLRLTRAEQCRLRYALAIAALGLFLLLAGGTFLFQLAPPAGSQGWPSPTTGPLPLTGVGPAPWGPPPDSAIHMSPAGGPTAAPEGMLPHYFPLFISGWWLGVLILSVRLTGGWLVNRRLRTHQVRALPPAWQEKVARLHQRLEMPRATAVLVSLRAQVPLVIGHLKPVILLPAAVLTGLPAEQVEAVLAHELAHVRRLDPLVNLLQSMAEILFFYHPAVWWMSSVIRREREHCCDELAVGACENPLLLARALVNLQQQSFRLPQPGLTVVGGRNQLYRRILLMTTSPHPSAALSARMSFIVIVALTVMMFTAWMNIPVVAHPAAHAAVSAVPAEGTPDVTTQKEITSQVITFQRPAANGTETFVVSLKNGRIDQVKRNGQVLSAAEIAALQPWLDKTVKQALSAKPPAPPAAPAPPEPVALPASTPPAAEAPAPAALPVPRVPSAETPAGAEPAAPPVPPMQAEAPQPPAPPAPEKPARATSPPPPPPAVMAPPAPPVPPAKTGDWDERQAEKRERDAREAEREVRETERIEREARREPEREVRETERIEREARREAEREVRETERVEREVKQDAEQKARQDELAKQKEIQAKQEALHAAQAERQHQIQAELKEKQAALEKEYARVKELQEKIRQKQENLTDEEAQKKLQHLEQELKARAEELAKKRQAMATYHVQVAEQHTQQIQEQKHVEKQMQHRVQEIVELETKLKTLEKAVKESKGREQEALKKEMVTVLKKLEQAHKEIGFTRQELDKKTTFLRNLRRLLVDENVVADNQTAEIVLDDDGLEVNGEIQPARLHEHALKLYQQHVGEPLPRRLRLRLDNDKFILLPPK